MTFHGETSDPPDVLRVSDEHSAVLVAPVPLSDDLELPDGYRRSIERAVAQRCSGDQPRPASGHG